MNVLQTHVRNGLHNQIGNLVAVAEMVMEGNGHAVLQTGLFNGFPNTGKKLYLTGSTCFHFGCGSGAHPHMGEGTGEFFHLAVMFNVIGNISLQNRLIQLDVCRCNGLNRDGAALAAQGYFRSAKVQSGQCLSGQQLGCVTLSGGLHLHTGQCRSLPHPEAVR
jgi:hypothetical protein